MDLMRLLMLSAGIVMLGLECEGAGRLSYNFYKESCPQVENIVREGVHSASIFDPTTSAALLRLLFHDCQVQGCDASILLDARNEPSEVASSKSFGIRKRNIVDLIKASLEQVCPGQVSCADVLVLATRDAVSLSGGPRINVPLGRRDSRGPPNVRLADSSLPPNDIGLKGALKLFSKKGMTVEETVAILGAHTLGITHCFSLRSRLYKPGNAINAGFVNTLKLKCPPYDGNTTSKIKFVVNDLTPIQFDNEYFVNTMRGRGVLSIDAALPLDSRTRPFVEKFASDRNAFYRAFSSAFVKLSSSNVLIGNQGVIRRSCNRVD
ncbi:peroxidase 29 [Salvia hispanica]|uniref:peroxidase 29 n=1 Tax=Salvia hispanica TaxID=49212 RepID=UPI002008F3BC|nr:peroxidase 29 [Salvia hispanica]